MVRRTVTMGPHALAAAVATLALVLASCSSSVDSSSDSTTPEGEDVVLQGVDAEEVDPFTESVTTAQFASFSTEVADAIEAALGGFEAAGDAMRAIPGDTPGLYGGTGEDATCDMDRLDGYLADADNSAKAAAFAEVLGIEAGSIGASLDEFTTVVLSVDVFVTNHGFRDGAANAFGAVLEAGTAIAVDTHGVPRVKCGCGNPLGPAPEGVILGPDTPTTGEAWSGWDPVDVATTEPTGDPVDGFEVIDMETGETYRIPAGGTPPSVPSTDPPATDPPATTTATTVAPEPDDDAPPADPDDRSWGVTGGAVDGTGDPFRLMCAPNGTFQDVYGGNLGTYATKSSVCTAAVHAGIITREKGGMVTIAAIQTPPHLDGSTANGVTSKPVDSPSGAFHFR